jgi:hypothetical protein
MDEIIDTGELVCDEIDTPKTSIISDWKKGPKISDLPSITITC